MNPALWISKTGLDAQTKEIAVISNNLANASRFLKAYQIQHAPPDWPGHSWLELLICFEIHGQRIEMDEGYEHYEACHARAGTRSMFGKSGKS